MDKKRPARNPQGGIIPQLIPTLLVQKHFPDILRKGVENMQNMADEKELQFHGMKPLPDEQLSKQDSLYAGLGAGLIKLLGGNGQGAKDFFEAFMRARQSKLDTKNKQKNQNYEIERERVKAEAQIAGKKADAAEKTRREMLERQDFINRQKEQKNERISSFVSRAFSAGSPQEAKYWLNEAKNLGWGGDPNVEGGINEEVTKRVISEKFNKALANNGLLPSQRKAILEQYNNALAEQGLDPFMKQEDIDNQFHIDQSTLWDKKSALILSQINPVINDVKKNLSEMARRKAISPSEIANTISGAVEKIKAFAPDLRDTGKNIDALIQAAFPEEMFSGYAGELGSEARARAQLAIAKERLGIAQRNAPLKTANGKSTKESFGSFSKEISQWDINLKYYQSKQGWSDSKLIEWASKPENTSLFPINMFGGFVNKNNPQYVKMIRDFVDKQVESSKSYLDELKEAARFKTDGSTSGSGAWEYINGKWVNKGFNPSGGSVNTPANRGVSRSQMLQGRSSGRVTVKDNGGAAGTISPEIAWVRDNSEKLFGVKAMSTYRSKEWNERVGGSKTSRHMAGEAIDLATSNVAKGDAIVKWALENGHQLGFRQIIWRDKSYRYINGKWVQQGKISGHYDHVHLGR